MFDELNVVVEENSYSMSPMMDNKNSSTSNMNENILTDTFTKNKKSTNSQHKNMDYLFDYFLNEDKFNENLKNSVEKKQ